MQDYDVVRVIRIRDSRFVECPPQYKRNPKVGDTGTILLTYTVPAPAFEVECCDSEGITVWIEAMFPDELEPVNEDC